MEEIMKDGEEVGATKSPIGVYFDPALRARIERAARAEGLSFSAVVRRAAMRDLAREREQSGEAA
jgi:hypothetical protein